jgi:hypothetical protein
LQSAGIVLHRRIKHVALLGLALAQAEPPGGNGDANIECHPAFADLGLAGNDSQTFGNQLGDAIRDRRKCPALQFRSGIDVIAPIERPAVTAGFAVRLGLGFGFEILQPAPNGFLNDVAADIIDQADRFSLEIKRIDDIRLKQKTVANWRCERFGCPFQCGELRVDLAAESSGGAFGWRRQRSCGISRKSQLACTGGPINGYAVHTRTRKAALWSALCDARVVSCAGCLTENELSRPGDDGAVCQVWAHEAG